MDDNLYQDLPDEYSEMITKMEDRIVQLENELGSLSGRLQESLSRITELENKLPNSSLVSPKFLPRAFTVWGHYFVANFLIAIPFICITIIVTILLAAFGGINQY
jgi:hypothetical protein